MGFDWDWITAEREFRHAIELKPQYGPAHIWYSHLLKAIDRTEESLAESKRALECDPLGLVLNMHMGWHLVYARQYEKAIEHARRHWNSIQPSSWRISSLARRTSSRARSQTRSRHSRKQTSCRAGHPTYLADLGHGFAIAGRRAEAMQVLDELHEAASQRYVASRASPRFISDLARWTSVSPGWSVDSAAERMLIHIRDNPRYDPLRGDPRYIDLVRRMNFRIESERSTLTAVHDDRRPADPAGTR
jgi:serine/threonine-protein kinase